MSKTTALPAPALAALRPLARVYVQAADKSATALRASEARDRDTLAALAGWVSEHGVNVLSADFTVLSRPFASALRDAIRAQFASADRDARKGKGDAEVIDEAFRMGDATNAARLATALGYVSVCLSMSRAILAAAAQGSPDAAACVGGLLSVNGTYRKLSQGKRAPEADSASAPAPAPVASEAQSDPAANLLAMIADARAYALRHGLSFEDAVARTAPQAPAPAPKATGK